MHHAPCEVLHALLVGQALLRLAEEAPDLSGQRVLLAQVARASTHPCDAILETGESVRLGQGASCIIECL